MMAPDTHDRMHALAAEIRRFIRERDWEQYHTPKNLAMALSVETAEIVELFQWLTAEESSALGPEKRTALEEEIGDVMIYLTTLAEKFAIDPIEAAIKKSKLNARKYPADRVRGKSSKYDEY
jgi:dCTP diphosphatase